MSFQTEFSEDLGVGIGTAGPPVFAYFPEPAELVVGQRIWIEHHAGEPLNHVVVRLSGVDLQGVEQPLDIRGDLDGRLNPHKSRWNHDEDTGIDGISSPGRRETWEKTGRSCSGLTMTQARPGYRNQVRRQSADWF